MKTIDNYINALINKHKCLKCRFYKVLNLSRLLMALLMGVVMDLLDFGPKLCAKWYYLRH